MKENPEFIGRRYSEEEKARYEASLRKWSDEELKPIEGELEKTAEEIKILEAVSALIGVELHSIGIEGYRPIAPEKVHILSAEIFKKNFPGHDYKAFFTSTSDVVYLNKEDVDTDAHMFSTLLHELIHRASMQKFYVNNGSCDIHDARTGYRIRSPWKDVDRKHRLFGLNELMTDYTAYKILRMNRERMREEFGISEEDIQGPIYSAYMKYAPILESIIKKVSADKNIPVAQVFEDFERGQFQNSILVLKDVERSFGKGALNALSLLGTLEKEADNSQLDEMVKRFFIEDNEANRSEISREISGFVKEVQKS